MDRQGNSDSLTQSRITGSTKSITYSRENGIDIMKFIMSILVVAIHTMPLFYSNNALLIRLFATVSPLAVPFFFISTGYFIRKSENAGKKDVLVKRLKSFIKLFLIWSLIYLPLAVFDYCFNDTSFLYDLEHYIYDLFMLGEHYNSYMLWYLLSCIYAVFVILLMDAAGLERAVSVWLCIGIGFVFGLAADVIKWYDGSSSVMGILQLILKYSIQNGRIFYGLIYIPIGMILSEYRTAVWKNALMFAAGFALVFVSYSVLTPVLRLIGVIICSVGLFGLVVSTKLRSSWCYPMFRTVSTVVYFTHLWIWTVYYYFVYGHKEFGMDCFIATSLISVILGVLYSWQKKAMEATFRNNY